MTSSHTPGWYQAVVRLHKHVKTVQKSHDYNIHVTLCGQHPVGILGYFNTPRISQLKSPAQHPHVRLHKSAIGIRALHDAAENARSFFGSY